MEGVDTTTLSEEEAACEVGVVGGTGVLGDFIVSGKDIGVIFKLPHIETVLVLLLEELALDPVKGELESGHKETLLITKLNNLSIIL